MDFQGVKKYISKLEQVMALYADHEELSNSEKQLMVDYLRRIYQQVQSLPTSAETEMPDFPKEDKTTSTAPVEEKKFLDHSDKPKNDVNIPSPALEGISELPKLLSSSPYDHLFEHWKVADLSEKLELTPIKDLRSGLGLNERILAQNELFGGKKEEFDRILSELNLLPNLESCKSYLIEKVIPVFHWDQHDKEKYVESFLKLILRRHS